MTDLQIEDSYMEIAKLKIEENEFDLFLNLTPKDKIVVLPLHRNVLDGPMTKYKENVPYTPEIFFKILPGETICSSTSKLVTTS